MATTNHPAKPCGATPAIRADTGGWLGGNSVSTEQVPADQVRAGDRLILDDGTLAEVTDVRRGDYWLNSGRHGPVSRSAGGPGPRQESCSARRPRSCCGLHRNRLKVFSRASRAHSRRP
jgi:hypothetical protein